MVLTKLTDDIKKSVIDYVSKDTSREILIGFDYGDAVSKSDIKKILESDDIDDGVACYADELFECNLDYMTDYEANYVKNIMERFNLDTGLTEEVADVCREAGMKTQLDIDGLFKNTNVRLRLDLLSNYDCINSHHFENGYRYEESYFGDILKLLKVNPQAFKKYVKENNCFSMEGKYPRINGLDKLTVVNFKDLVSEIENSCSPANLFTFVVDSNLYDAIELLREVKNRKVVTIKAGTKCGLFSSMYGGGSTLDLTLEKDLTTPLQWGTYDRLLFVVDGTDGYSIEETYCPSSDCFSEGGFVLS